MAAKFLILQSLILWIEAVDIDQLKTILQAPIFPNWPVNSNFSGFDTLHQDERSIKLGMEFEGALTSKAIQRIVNRVLMGDTITMLVFGGSNTRGAELGPRSNEWTYHHIVRAWWNNAIAPLTGSFMKREVIAVGGVGTTYFGHCWKEYLAKDAYIDLLLWEFFINDPDSEDYGKGTEKFIRSVLQYYSQPALIFAKFFSRCPLESEPTATCMNRSVRKDTLLLTLCKIYNVTSLNLFYSTFDYMHRTKLLRPDELFIETHPSHIAHAQMAYLIISHLRQQMLKDMTIRETLFSFFKFNKDNLGYLTSRNRIANQRMILPDLQELPPSLFNTVDINSTCWSAILPDDRFVLPHSLFALRVEQRMGFSKDVMHRWNMSIAVRRDVRGGWKSSHANGLLSIDFNIEHGQLGNIYVSISHLLEGGYTTLSVLGQHGYYRTINVECSRLTHKAQHVYFVGQFPEGGNRLTMQTITGGCELNAIIVE